jgi:lincosamide nucleotidyltransferase A/C/D/E
MDAARVLDLLACLRTCDIAFWLDGGWAIDALLAEQTRPHDDLDLVARLTDSARIEQALRERGYVLAFGAPPSSFELVDGEGHQVDVHPASFTTTGEGVYKMANGEDWIYPAEAFRGIGHILRQEVPCLTPEVVMISHTTGYALDDAHRQDVRALGERYGIPVPEFRERD